MDVGFLTFVFSDVKFPEVIKWAGANGFHQMEAWSGHVDPCKIVEKGKTELAETLSQSNVNISSIFVYQQNNLNPDLKRRRDNIRSLELAIDACSQLEIPAITTSAGSPHKRPHLGLNPWGIYYHSLPLPKTRDVIEEAVRIFGEVFGPLVDYAQDHDVRIALEPSSIGGGHGSIATTPEMWLKLFRAVPSKHLGVCFDPSHLNWIGIDCLNAARKFSEMGRIVTVHGKDNEVITSRLKEVGILGDGWWRHRLPGWGDIKWPALIHALREGGYNGVINIEHEDEFFGFEVDWSTLKVKKDLDKIKNGLVLSRKYLLHAIRTAGQ